MISLFAVVIRVYIIKEYFANYFLHESDVTIDLKNNDLRVINKRAESWKVTLVDTGEFAQTGGRIALFQITLMTMIFA